MVQRLTIYYYFLVFCIFATDIILSLNIEELKAVNYEVDILQTPIQKEEQAALPVVHMTSIFGQEYQCILPEVEEEELSEKVAYSEKSTDIKDLLKPLHSGNCLLKAKDWWTYELCFGQYIKQFHIEDGQIIGQVITLGLYDSDYDWNNETDKEKFKHVKQRYHSQFYVNGSKCDLTGHPRVAEIRIYCEEDAGDYIYRVDEPGTCSYVITIHTSRVCTHPQLKPLPSKKAHTIPCHPILNEEQYVIYLEKLNEEKALAHQKRSQWLSNQHERLQEMKNENLHGGDNSDPDPAFQEFFKKLIKVLKKDTGEDILNSNDMKEENEKFEIDPGVVESEKDEDDTEITEIDKLKSVLTPEKFAAVKTIIQEYFDAIFTEGEEDSKAELTEEGKDAAYQKFRSTVNFLLKKMDKAEKDMLEAQKKINKVIADAAMDDTTHVTGKAEVSELEIGSKKNKIDEEKESVQESDQSKETLLDEDDDELQVHIKRLEKAHSGKIYEIDQMQQQKLAQAIKENLEKSGISTGGRRIEVKIIKAGHYDNQLTDEEANQFQNMITALLTGEQEALQEMERNKKLEENYKFTWDTRHEEDAED